MLCKLVRFANSRWLRIGVVVLWLLSLLSIFTFVRESHEKFPGGSEDRYNYFEIHRSALFVWLSLVLFGYAAYHFKRRSLGWYGVVEVGVGLIGGFVAVQRIPVEDPASWFALAASAYVIVRGAGNVAYALADEATLNSIAVADTVPDMSNIRPTKTPVAEQARKAAEDMGAEPLEGSGFENEVPDPKFSDTAPSVPEPRTRRARRVTRALALPPSPARASKRSPLPSPHRSQRAIAITLLSFFTALLCLELLFRAGDDTSG